MNQHLTAEYLLQFKSRDLIKLNCEYCKKMFKRKRGNIQKNSKKSNIYCSRRCFSSSKLIFTKCANCKKDITKNLADVKKSKSGNVFCSKSCSATHNNKSSPKRKPLGKCKNCETPIPTKDTYCSLGCKIIFKNPNKQGAKKRKEQNKKAVISYRQRSKIKAVGYKGGKCEVCGYSKCMRSLHFHHKNPAKKDFGIGKVTLKWDKVKLELDKCMLICSNCHGEVHAGLINIENY